MPEELTIYLPDWREYRLVSPGYSPGTPNRVTNDPEYVEPDWQVEDIQAPDETGEWVPLELHEWEALVKRYWRELCEACRVCRQTQEVREP